MRKIALLAFCLFSIAVVDAPAANHREGPILGIGKLSLQTYTLGHYPGTLYVSLKDLAKAVGVTPDAFHVEGTKLIAAGDSTNFARTTSSLLVCRSGEISSGLIRHIGEIWVPAPDILKALGATPEIALQKFGRGQGAGQIVRLSIRSGCDTCLLKLR